ncbi:MAG TPA: aquaporin [Candidatus Tumulicola sp.]|jgi:aquaporin Z
MRNPSVVQKLGAEAIGTFMVTAAAIGVDIFYYSQGNVDYVSRWLTRGFVVAVVIYAFADTSGAHVDPAVTIGFWIRRLFSFRLTAAYVFAQFAGAFAAAALWLWLLGPSALALGASHPGPQFSPLVAALAECVLTFALMLVILMTAQAAPSVGKQAALAVGFAVAACGFVAGPISGASMNPARTIAPQILSGNFANIWIYVVGPVCGAGLAVVAHWLLCGAPSPAQARAARGKSHAADR